MADDINLPNLVSHLQVNLGNTNGLVADATRQGSSVGSAIGQSMQRTLRAAVDDIPDIEIDGDSSELDRDLHRVRRQLDELANQRIGVDISIEDALRQMERLEPHLERLQRSHPSVNVTAAVGGALADLEELRLAAREVDDTDVDIDVDVDTDDLDRRFDGVRRSLSRITGLIGGLGKLAVPFAAASAAVGTLVPLVAGLSTALANVAPAAAVAVSGLLAVKLATGTIKLAMIGVEDAVKAALDPSDPEAYAEALKKLSPNARLFVGEIRKAQPALDKIRKTVQDKVFAGLDQQLRSTAKAALPELRAALNSTAYTLNQMAVGVFAAARSLARDGTLGAALDGATTGLAEFRRAPGQIVTALGQIGAAAAPAFARLSAAGGSALDRLSEKLTASFESGGMERAIEQAIDLFAQLGRVMGNIGGILKNVFGGLTSDGQGLFSTLETITASLREATASAGFQRALAALSQTMGVVASTVGPLLAQALAVLGPVIEKLAPPAQELVRVLGGALSEILTALGPVLGSAADAVGSLVVSLLPLVEVAGELIAAVLPALVPLFDSLAQLFVEMAPTIQALADNLAAQLVPLLASLGPILAEILPPLVQMAAEVFPQITETLVQLAPSLGELAVALADLLVQLAPIIGQLIVFAATFLHEVLPAIRPVIDIVIQFVTGALSVLTDFITRYAIPIVQMLAALLQGDFTGAMRAAATGMSNLNADASTAFTNMRATAVRVVVGMVSEIPAAGKRMAAGFVAQLQTMVLQAGQRIAELPGRIRNALPSPSSILSNAGRLIMQGLINGITSMIPSLSGTLNSITAKIPDWKGPKKKDASLLTPAGKSIIKGLIDGIDASTASLKSKLTSITNLIERAISINKGNRSKTSGLGSLLGRVEKDNKRLLSLAKARDVVATKLKAAQKALDDAIKTRTKRAADIQAGILGEADITQGFGLVNSVTAITVGLQQAVKRTQEFAANIAKLKKAGLRSDLLGDIADAGVDGGAATAAALAKATPEELARINALQAQLAKAASTTGTTVATALYDSGVRAAQGLVDGLKKQQKNIEKQMTSIANAMVKAIKKALDMHSPSRRLRAVGEMAMAGMPQGFEAMRARVIRSAASVAGAAVNAAQTVASVRPSIPSPGVLSAAYAGSAGGGDTHHTWNLYGTETRPDEIIRALSWRSLAGGR
ncbi:phage-related protein [Streptomyces griseus]